MTITNKTQTRLAFLSQVIKKEVKHLETTDARLFMTPFTLAKAKSLESDIQLAEQVDAFVTRFGRLQDTLGDKFLPLLLNFLAEKPSSMIDNLDRAEKLQLIASVDEWIAMRNLRNQMAHEYIDDLNILVSALETAHRFVPTLIDTASHFQQRISNQI